MRKIFLNLRKYTRVAELQRNPYWDQVIDIAVSDEIYKLLEYVEHSDLINK